MEEAVGETKWFFKVMMPGFQKTLNLPVALCKKLKLQRSSVEAVVKTCKGRWKVEMCRNQELGLICFKDGWPDFVHAHGLSIGDFVVFEHTGNYHFNAVVFGASACEKEYNLDALKNDPKDAPTNIKKRKAGDEKGCGEGTSYQTKNPYYIVTMKAHHGRKPPSVFIPQMFWTSNGIEGKREMIFRVCCGKEWPMRLYFEKNGQRRCRISGGWNQFYVGNELKEGDVCAFELIKNESKNVVVMVVHILQVPS